MQGKLIYEFGPFRLDPPEHLLLCEGRPVNISPQLFSLLLALVENSGHLLSKEELREKVWGEAYVSEDALKVIIGNLRKALGDNRNGDRYIETVPTKGYRFFADVRKIEESRGSLEKPSLRQMTVAEPAVPEPQAPSSSRATEQAGALVSDQCEVPQDALAQVSLSHGAESDITTTGGRHKNRKRLVPILAISLALITAAAAFFYDHPRRDSPDKAQPGLITNLTSRRTIAVFPFKNLSGRAEDSWLSAAFPEWLVSEIGAGGHLRVIPNEQVARLHSDLSWSAKGDYSPDKVAQTTKSVGTDFVIMGTFADSGGNDRHQLRLDLKVLDASSGQLVASLAETGDSDDLFGFVAKVGGALREKLGLLQVPPGDAQAVRATLPANQKAARLYIEGLEKFRALDPIAARQLLEQAVSADPKYPLAHSALAAAWSALGYEVNARREAGKALELASGLSREQYLEIEATYRETAKDWTKATQIYQTLSMFEPDNPDYGLRLAQAQINGRKGKEALATLQSLRSSSMGRPDDPRVDFLEAKADESIGDFQHELDSAEQAIAKGKARSERQLVGNALIAKAWALDNLGRAKEAEAAGNDAKEVYSLIGDRSGIGWALMIIADAISDEGKHADAIAGYTHALEVFRQVGNEHGIAIALNNMAFDMKDSGDLAGAKKAFGEAIAVCETTGDIRAEALAFNGMGTIFWREGNLAAARKMYQSALTQFQASGNQANAAKMLRNIALVLEDQGELAKARATFEEAISLDQQIGSKAELAANLENEGELLILQGDVSGAQLKCEESEKISRRHCLYQKLGTD